MKFINRVRHRWIWYGAAALIGLDALLFTTTDVTKIASGVVIVGFGLVVASVYVVLYGLLSLTSLYGLHIKRKRQLSLYLTGMAASLLALQSVGELARRDVLVLLPLILLGYTYSAYAKTNRRNLEG